MFSFMPSRALHRWQHQAQDALDEIEQAHQAVGGVGPGRRYATQQINQAYVVMVSSQFQRFCRDLHSEAADHLTHDPNPNPNPNPRYSLLRSRLTEGRKLDSQNPNPGNLGSDFGRFEFAAGFWGEVRNADPSGMKQLQDELELLNVWRNAIAHQDFTAPQLEGRTTVRLGDARRWRSTCQALALRFDQVVSQRLQAILGVAPW